MQSIITADIDYINNCD